MTPLDPPLGPADLKIDVDGPLEMIEHIPDLLGEAHGFGSFLFDPAGRPVVENGAVWLYTTRLAENGWESWVRSLNLATLRAGPARQILCPDPGCDRAVLHHAIAVAPDMIVGLYCDGVGFAAALAGAPDAAFVPDPEFAVRPQIGWETRGGGTEGWTLECNGAHVLIAEGPEGIAFWQGYDSYRRDGRLGDLGWQGIRVDRKARRVMALERHPQNPLPFRKPEWSCVRCGGNLGSDILGGEKRAFFYYIRPDAERFFIGMALSEDPLFGSTSAHHVVGSALGDEIIAEKFQALSVGEDILLFYESRRSDDSWRTALRRFRHRKRA